ncbi:MAG: hypothetical protein ACKVWV_13375 [Planctomycetota bacterium]
MSQSLGDAWQENKRFVAGVAVAVGVFLIGLVLIGHFFGSELVRARRVIDTTSRKLKSESMYAPDDLAAAQSDNEALKASLETLRRAVAFAPRARFVHDAAHGSASNHYFATVSGVREELLTLAGRANLRLADDLGLPALSPTREEEIARYLEGLDVVDRAVRMAIESGVQRIDRIEIKLDPALNSKQGVGEVESTRVEIALSGAPGPIVEFLRLSQAAPGGAALGPLLVEKALVTPTRSKVDEATLEITFVAARLTQAAEPTDA